MNKVSIDGRRIRDESSFHDAFAEALGFPASYGRNMDAWVDCMSSLDDPSVGMSNIHAKRGLMLLQIEHAGEFSEHCPKLFAVFLDAVAFVNWRQIEASRPALLALAYRR
jgi:hypothetical protein